MSQESQSSSSSSKLLLTVRIAGAILVAAVWIFWAVRATGWQHEFVLDDTFDDNARIRSFMQDAGGTHVPGEGLFLAADSETSRTYLLARSPFQKLFLRAEAASNPQVQVAISIPQIKGTHEIDPALLDGQWIDLTDVTPDGVGTRVNIRMTNSAPPGSPDLLALKSFAVRITTEAPTVRASAFLFYAASGIFFWVAVFCFLLPRLLHRLSADRAQANESARLAFLLGLLAIVVAGAWLCKHPQWTAKKDYDDRAAISNAAMLVDSGFDQKLVYFRSRVRPGFVAAVQPLLIAPPHQLASFWANPSDFFRQIWWIYDQDNSDFGLFTYPTLSLASMLLAFLTIMMLYDLYRELDLAPRVAAFAMLLCLVFFSRSLTIAITQTFNLFVNVLAVWLFVRLKDDPAINKISVGPTIFAGLALGFAILVKETAATTVLAVYLFILVSGPRFEISRRIIRSIPYWIAAAFLPLWYFVFVADGGLGEIISNFGNHLEQEGPNQFEALTLLTGLRDMAVVFSYPGLIVAAIGIGLAARGRFSSRIDRLMLCWTIGCLPVFALPYIFPRFLQYFIPSLAYWCAIVANEAYSRLSPGADDAPQS